MVTDAGPSSGTLCFLRRASELAWAKGPMVSRVTMVSLSEVDDRPADNAADLSD